MSTIILNFIFYNYAQLGTCYIYHNYSNFFYFTMFYSFIKQHNTYYGLRYKAQRSNMTFDVFCFSILSNAYINDPRDYNRYNLK